MRKAFCDVYDDMKAPEEWKSRVKEEMHKELLNGSLQKNHVGTKKASPVVRIGITMLMTAALIGVLVYSFKENNSIYITQMDENAYYAQVELKEGELNFIERGEALDIMQNAGVVEEGEAMESEETTENAFQSEFKIGEGSIIMKKTNGELPEAAVEEYSYLGGQKIYLTTTTKGETKIFKAYFIKKDFLYTLTGEGVSQKEFIDFLYKEIK